MLGLLDSQVFCKYRGILCLALAFYFQSCQSDIQVQTLQNATPEYTLRLGDKTDLGKRWGTRYEVFVDHQTAASGLQSRLAFFAYDLNDDGHFELVEQLDQDGQVIRRGYDLDFDGDLDSIEPQNPGIQNPRIGN